MRILVIEDDPTISALIERALLGLHYAVDVAADGAMGLELGCTSDYDLIMLDVVLPKLDGCEVCRQLRSEGVGTPVLMLTALDADEDVIRGLDAGADDYLTKPFNLSLMLARVRSLTRRRSTLKTTEISFGSLRIDTARRTVERDGAPIELTTREFALLEYFILNLDRVLSREMICEHLWDVDYDPRSNVVDSLVRWLRLKIDRDHNASLIDTVRGFGYRISAPDGVSAG